VSLTLKGPRHLKHVGALQVLSVAGEALEEPYPRVLRVVAEALEDSEV
jgi:hypothetical protein